MICVIIPYYQRTAGVLARALESVFAQDIDEQVLILIVDDASPIPAASEIANLRPPARIDIQVVSQANAGPGAARNTGLGLVPAAAQIIAFLDSDDVWQPSHLSRLRKAFDQGADLYLANWEEMSGSSMLDSLLPTLADGIHRLAARRRPVSVRGRAGRSPSHPALLLFVGHRDTARNPRTGAVRREPCAMRARTSCMRSNWRRPGPASGSVRP
jgi:succinoglycan biosynthesis protein ExoW